MRFTESIDDSAFYPENYGLGRDLGAITQASIHRDIIFVNSILMARKATFGYRIVLTRDTCIVKYFRLADENIFAINKSDKPSHLIVFVCRRNKLTLARKPQFKIGESMLGAVELETNDLWVVRDGQYVKIKVKLTAYFKAKVSEFQADQKDPFKDLH